MPHSLKRSSAKVLLRGSTALLTAALVAAVAATSLTGPEPLVSTAQAQNVSLTVQFRTALEPHGRWSRHSRWGEVWIPAKRDRDWRPYTEGRWVYTDEWGWYWASDEDFGWVTYHYGRWVRDPQFGWVWIPGNEWAPAWVQWRRGDRHAGWAPLPPRQVYYEYDDDPEFWIFVSFNNFTSRNLRTVILPPRERVVIIQQTVIVNRTIYVDSGPSVAFNPGIEPSIVAARVGEPIRVTEVQPRVISGTTGVRNAVEISGENAAQLKQPVRAEIKESKETIEAAKDVPAPQALSRGEQGRVGERAPRAAKEAKVGPGSVKETEAPAATRGEDTTKSRAEDAEAKSKDAAKAKPEDDKAKSQAEDASKAKPEDTAKAKSRADDAKAKADDDAAKTKASAREKDEKDDKEAKAKAQSKSEPKARAQDAEKSKPEPRQAAPKSAPEPKQESRSRPEPKSAPEPRQAAPKAAPEPKQESRARPEPKAAPEPRQAAPKPEPKQQAAPPPAPQGQAAPRAESQRKQPVPKEAAPAPKKKGKEKDKEG